MSMPSKLPRNIGWGLSLLVAALLVFSASMKIMQPAKFLDGWVHQLGFPAGTARWVGFVELTIAILYLVPRTTVLGAILVAAYLGGAVCTHVRMAETEAVMPLVLGVLAWGGLWLRDPRVRALLPLTPAA